MSFRIRDSKIVDENMTTLEPRRSEFIRRRAYESIEISGFNHSEVCRLLNGDGLFRRTQDRQGEHSCKYNFCHNQAELLEFSLQATRIIDVVSSFNPVLRSGLHYLFHTELKAKHEPVA